MVLRDKKQPGAASGRAERWPPAPGAGFSALVSERDDHIARSLPVGRQEITRSLRRKPSWEQAKLQRGRRAGRAEPGLYCGLDSERGLHPEERPWRALSAEVEKPPGAL